MSSNKKKKKKKRNSQGPGSAVSYADSPGKGGCHGDAFVQWFAPGVVSGIFAADTKHDHNDATRWDSVLMHPNTMANAVRVFRAAVGLMMRWGPCKVYGTKHQTPFTGQTLTHVCVVIETNCGG